MQLAEAMAYLHHRGTPSQQAQLLAWQTHQPLPAAAQSALFDGQQTAGGWAAWWSGTRPSIDATCYRLTQALMAAVPLSALTMSLQWLAARQSQDGAWEEAVELHEVAPPWSRPGDQKATLYLTANAGWVLMRAGWDSAGRAAGSYLAQHLTTDATLPSFMQTHWLSAGLWRLTGQQAEADSISTTLQSALASLSAGALIWMGNCFLDAHLSLTHPLLLSIEARLTHLQQSDGSWPSDDEPSLTPQTTLEAIRFLLFLAS